jgi:pimeloyl-ACP methyl ester carboxylesterase
MDEAHYPMSQQDPLRRYGTPPYAVAVVHGGPGAAGEMAPVARELATGRGDLEPLQTASTLDGQVTEPQAQLVQASSTPVTLLGYSWGAWLSFIVAARFPTLVKKLILVSSGPFEEYYVAVLHATRMARLTATEQAEFAAIGRALGNPTTADHDGFLARLGELTAKTDTYHPLGADEDESTAVEVRGAVFQQVWKSAAALRRSGALLDLARDIRCEVVAIHSEYDPHPAEGVRTPLAATVSDFRFVLLEHCGHTPWRERHARDRFYAIVAAELAEGSIVG